MGSQLWSFFYGRNICAVTQLFGNSVFTVSGCSAAFGDHWLLHLWPQTRFSLVWSEDKCSQYQLSFYCSLSVQVENNKNSHNKSVMYWKLIVHMKTSDAKASKFHLKFSSKILLRRTFHTELKGFCIWSLHIQHISFFISPSTDFILLQKL